MKLKDILKSKVGTINETYVDQMGGHRGANLEKALDKILEEWEIWKTNDIENLDPKHLKPARKELLDYVQKWLNKKVK